MADTEWRCVEKLKSMSYTCGHCGESLASQIGYRGMNEATRSNEGLIYICHYCHKPTYFDLIDGNIIPGNPYGEKIDDIHDKPVNDLYEEVRLCMSCGAYTASVMCSRKLLMNIAVSKEAKEGLSFAEYVEYLSEKGYVPPDGKEYLTHVKDMGNEANHKIAIAKKEDAEDLIDFLGMVLQFNYKYPAKLKKRKEKK
ncbi:MAG: DUF4145 domain-containing protein [Candidatus Omnitrophica bacterium]|nr:DUF4145 domain-containing protein [Candidatus Omnitrophota bacterium]